MPTEDVIEWLESLNYDMGEETQEVAEAIKIAIEIIKTKTKKESGYLKIARGS